MNRFQLMATTDCGCDDRRRLERSHSATSQSLGICISPLRKKPSRINGLRTTWKKVSARAEASASIVRASDRAWSGSPMDRQLWANGPCPHAWPAQLLVQDASDLRVCLRDTTRSSCGWCVRKPDRAPAKNTCRLARGGNADVANSGRMRHDTVVHSRLE